VEARRGVAVGRAVVRDDPDACPVELGEVDERGADLAGDGLSVKLNVGV
jgi:hypothetical protein